MPSRRSLAYFAGCLALLPTGAAAADVQHLSGAVSVLIGTSCNVLILPADVDDDDDDDGTLIVDDQRRSNFDETLTGVKQVANLPVRYVVDTHWHLDHSGANGSFAAAGAQIIAQRNVRIRRSTEQYMAAYNQHIPADVPAALPTVIYDKKLVLHRGSETVELTHVPNAHTDGDTLVRFRHANVIAMGDVFFNHIFPFIDLSSDGSVQGMIKGVEKALSLGDDRTQFVPAHGPVANRAELIAYRDMLRTVSLKVRSAIRAGQSRQQIVASHPAAAYRQGMSGEEDRFVEAVYDSYRNEDLHHRICRRDDG